MKHVIWRIGFVLCLAGCASAAPADMKGKTLTAESSSADVLDALDLVGQGLKDFDAKVTMSEEDNVSGADSKRVGRVWYRKQGEENASVHVVFDRRIVGSKAQDKKVEYLLAGPWLTDRDYDRRVEIRRQVIKPGQKINLLKLGEGPFPLPIGQKREDVLAVFDVKKIPAAKDDPAGAAHLELSPKKGTSFDRKFKTIEVWVDGKSHFPVRIATLDKNETTTRTTDLTEVRVNPGLKDSDFELTKIDGKWDSTQEDYVE